MSVQETILIIAILATLVPVVAVAIRGRARQVVGLATVLCTVAVAFHLFALLRLVQIGPRPVPISWTYTAVASALPILLAGFAFSACFGRQDPSEAFRISRRTFGVFSAVGIVFLALLRHPQFITGYDWVGPLGTIHLGFVGKAYLSYLLIGLVLVGHNLEKTYRISPSGDRYKLRLALMGLFSLLGYFIFLLASGLLYASVGLGKLISSSLPIAFASFTVAYGYLKGGITDLHAPTSRGVVYSSFTALAAGLFVLSIGLAAQVATLTNWSPDEILIITFGFLAILTTVLLLVSNRFQRSVRRFIDRNFYVNRFDYRSQWAKITAALEGARTQEELLAATSIYLADTFDVGDLTIASRGPASSALRPMCGKGSDDGQLTLQPDSPLYQRLERNGKAMMLDRRPHDMTNIPIYAEDTHWLNRTASTIVAPLLDHGQLTGMIGLERDAEKDPFTFEDVALLESMSTHVAAAMRAMTLAQQVAETRESELMSQWSSMLLHDLKNYLSPLRMAGANLEEYKDDPEAVGMCATDVKRVVTKMEALVGRLSELRQGGKLGMRPICPNKLVQDAVTDMQLRRHGGLVVTLKLEAESPIEADHDMLRRVIENLITNAVEAMDGEGRLTLATKDFRQKGAPQVHIQVQDNGRGIPAEFIRDGLFRPFSTTKQKGLGLGLYQCRSIVQAHGGELSVESRVGEGSRFQIALEAGEWPEAIRARRAEESAKTTKAAKAAKGAEAAKGAKAANATDTAKTAGSARNAAAAGTSRNPGRPDRGPDEDSSGFGRGSLPDRTTP